MRFKSLLKTKIIIHEYKQKQRRENNKESKMKNNKDVVVYDDDNNDFIDVNMILILEENCNCIYIKKIKCALSLYSCMYKQTGTKSRVERRK